MPARLTKPSAHAAWLGLKPISTRYFVWCTWTAYQAYRPDRKPAAIHQNRAVRRARASVQSIAAQAGSTTLAARRAAAASRDDRSPSGSSPRSSGRRASRRLSGTSSTSTSTAMAQQALRQPARPMSVCSHGSRRIEPTPTPEKATLIASPRRRTNQFGR